MTASHHMTEKMIRVILTVAIGITDAEVFQTPFLQLNVSLNLETRVNNPVSFSHQVIHFEHDLNALLWPPIRSLLLQCVRVRYFNDPDKDVVPANKCVVAFALPQVELQRAHIEREASFHVGWEDLKSQRGWHF